MKNKWIFPEPAGAFPPSPVEAGKEDIHPVVGALLRQRGILSREEQREFLSEKPRLTYDSFLMKDMKAAAEMILKAAAENRVICIYGDYDADGICSVSLMEEILALLNARAFHYIPSRFKEGYGLNKEAIQSIHERGADLLLTVDCGSVSFEEVEYAKRLGMDVIVTDHHNMGETVSDCLLVNPKQTDCPYPDSALCGCGLAFKLAQALSRLDTGGAGGTSRIGKADLNRVLDLAAIATIGDIVPLRGENRTIVKYGMKVLNRGSRAGLKCLVWEADLRPGEINAENIAYVIVPHLNAAGRLASAETGVLLLTAKEEEAQKEAAALLVEYNRERRRLQEEAFQNVEQLITELPQLPSFLLLHVPDAHEGITGIVAGKIKDAYYRPAVIVTPCGDGFLKGTGRSIPGVNLYEILSKASDLFIRFGGHEGACGFLMKEEHFSELQSILTEETEKLKEQNPEYFLPKLKIDAVLKPSDITFDLIRDLEKMAPFGHSNPKPVLCLQNVAPSHVEYMGDRKQHLRFQADGLECVFFGNAESAGFLLERGEPVDVAGYPGINRWKGRETIQFIVSDVR